MEALWGPEARPSALRPIQGVDDWLTLISTAMGMSSEATVTQYPRPGLRYRPVRDAPPISVFIASWKDDPSVLPADFTRLAGEVFAGAGTEGNVQPKSRPRLGGLAPQP